MDRWWIVPFAAISIYSFWYFGSILRTALKYNEIDLDWFGVSFSRKVKPAAYWLSFSLMGIVLAINILVLLVAISLWAVQYS